jgi:hypothetical protein
MREKAVEKAVYMSRLPAQSRKSRENHHGLNQKTRIRQVFKLFWIPMEEGASEKLIKENEKQFNKMQHMYLGIN